MNESDIYANVQSFDEPSGYRAGRKRVKGSETFHTMEPNTAGPAPSGASGVKPYRVAVVCLGLLCLLLLAALITGVCHYSRDNLEWKRDMAWLQTSYNNLTEERDQLQTSYNNLTEEREELQTSYNYLTEERDQLQTSHVRLTEELHHVKTRPSNVTEERDRLIKKLHDLMDPEGFYFSGSFYKISSVEKSWQESRDYCLERGADLVIINSREEQDFMRRLKKRLWIGLTDRETEGIWKWVDGTPVTTRFWASSEPNGVPGRDEDCAEIKMLNKLNSWNDESCDRKKIWICESTL